MFHDAALVGDYADHCIFVARQNETTRQKTRHSVNLMDRSRAKVLGVIFTGITTSAPRLALVIMQAVIVRVISMAMERVQITMQRHITNPNNVWIHFEVEFAHFTRCEIVFYIADDSFTLTAQSTLPKET